MSERTSGHDYYETEIIHVILTVEIRYKRGSDQARTNAVNAAISHHLDAGGAGLDGCYSARSVRAEVQRDAGDE